MSLGGEKSQWLLQIVTIGMFSFFFFLKFSTTKNSILEKIYFKFLSRKVLQKNGRYKLHLLASKNKICLTFHIYFFFKCSTTTHISFDTPSLLFYCDDLRVITSDMLSNEFHS